MTFDLVAIPDQDLDQHVIGQDVAKSGWPSPCRIISRGSSITGIVTTPIRSSPTPTRTMCESRTSTSF
jgi:hypothetical protein